MTVLDPLAASRRIGASYRQYLLSTFGPQRPDLFEAFEDALSRGVTLMKGPLLQASAPFEQGRSVRELIHDGLLHPGFEGLAASFPLDRPLYGHQDNAITKAVGQRRNLVVSTGTGSGKTETFLLPIIDHLLREREAATLGQPGVRALLLYPMNALANDQLKRLRELLKPLPEITFGRYVGETKAGTKDAVADFRDRNPGLSPLPNEVLSREQMRLRPPHLLLTNFAMLEYLLLRPKDTALFDGSTGESWRFVALDEAHVYNGAQGTEIAMLLRRVRDRVLRSERGRLQCFATSATLGRGVADHPQLVRFASDLFDETFEWDDADPRRQDVVVAHRRKLGHDDEAFHEIEQDRIGSLQKGFRAGVDTAALQKLAGVALPPQKGELVPHYLHRLLAMDARVLELQRALGQGSIPLDDAARQLTTGPTGEHDLVSLIDLCTAAKGRDDDAPLIPARYHLFVRSLEGAFICLDPSHPNDEPRLILTRHEYCPACSRGSGARMFELAVCRNCRVEHLVGRVGVAADETQTFQHPQGLGPPITLLLGQGDGGLDEDLNDDADEPDEDADVRALCTRCGRLQAPITTCGCPAAASVPVTVVHPKRTDGEVHTCVVCASRTAGAAVTRFLTGTDAPVSVIATDLYQEIPPSSDLLLEEEVGQGRKLLCFSDSRQDAAFFAPYLERTYNRAVQRRLLHASLLHLGERGPTTTEIASELARRAEDTWVLSQERKHHSANLTEAAAWVVEELLAVDRRQSLEGTGLAEISVFVPRRWRPPPALLQLGFTESEVLDILQVLLATLRTQGAFAMPSGVDVRDDRFAPLNREQAVRPEGKQWGVVTWLPGKSDNRRSEYLRRVLATKGIDTDPIELLEGIWQHLADTAGPWRSTLLSTSDKKGISWKLVEDAFEIHAAGPDHLPYRCARCRRLWWRNVAGVCPGWRCTGTLGPADAGGGPAEAHYARLYQELSPIGLSIQEHTAQWTPAEASRIQDSFVRGTVNVLSCSTTFELGVDVGEIQAVLLRNVPPSPANYVQRAGRAGRRTDSAALVVTFAQRRSHDRTFFDNPLPMVDGVINPPSITLDNATIIRRHAHSVAFAAFERWHVDHGGVEHDEIGDFFEPAEGKSGDDEFLAWLRSRPQDLGEALVRVLPVDVAEFLRLDDWSWVDALIEAPAHEPSFGWLGRAGDEVRGDLALLAQAVEEAAEAKRFGAAEQATRTERTLRRRKVLSFLAARNILPKYGFPVDVVGLYVQGSGDALADKIELDRDLQLAISDYAPGAKVVAAKALWESTGLRCRPEHAWPSYRWAVCDDCGAFRRGLNQGGEDPCPVCGSLRRAHGRSGIYVLPIFGFIGRRSEDKPGEARPPRLSMTETFFGSYRDAEPDLERLESLAGSVPLHYRTSRQGRITVINRGPKGQQFRLCEWCGYGGVGGPGGRDPGHKDPRRPKRICKGTLKARGLGHEFLTDVLEIRLGMPLSNGKARSTLYALLEAAPAVGVQRSDVDGTLHHHESTEAPAFILYDAVAGGAGHAQRLAQAIPDLLDAALRRTRCECGRETSCYSCLRSYSNQIFHDQLVRGDAEDVLSRVLGNGVAG